MMYHENSAACNREGCSLFHTKCLAIRKNKHTCNNDGSKGNRSKAAYIYVSKFYIDNAKKTVNKNREGKLIRL